jgi:hypothetical protein
LFVLILFIPSPSFSQLTGGDTTVGSACSPEDAVRMTANPSGSGGYVLTCEGGVWVANLNASTPTTSSQVATKSYVDSIITTGSGSPVAVLFRYKTTANQTASYTQSGTTVTVTLANHGYLVGHRIQYTVSSGSLGTTNALSTIATIPNANTFTFTAPNSATTSGSLTLLRYNMLAQRGVHSVTRTDFSFYVNFASALSSTNYGFTGDLIASNTVNFTWDCYIQWGVFYDNNGNSINIPRATTGITGIVIDTGVGSVLSNNALYSPDVFVQIHPF